MMKKPRLPTFRVGDVKEIVWKYGGRVVKKKVEIIEIQGTISSGKKNSGVKFIVHEVKDPHKIYVGSIDYFTEWREYTKEFVLWRNKKKEE